MFILSHLTVNLPRFHAIQSLSLTHRFATGEFPGSVKFVAVIKEVAPVAGAATDAELGVEQFEVKYLGSNNPIYMDINKEFYKALGSKSLLSQPLHTWNPFRLYSDFRSMSQRLSEAKAEGNLKGEGITQGGIFIVSKEKGVNHSSAIINSTCYLLMNITMHHNAVDSGHPLFFCYPLFLFTPLYCICPSPPLSQL